jgi:hypothetical protein
MTRRGLRGHGREVAFLAFAILVAIVSIGGTLWVYLGDSSGNTGIAELRTTPLAREFRPPQQYELAALRREHPYGCRSDDRDCARSYLGDITSVYGPRASLALLAELRRDGRISPALDDHDLAHTVGRRAAERFGVNVQAFNLCPNTFNYGCPHGYFEEVLGRAGTPEAAAGAICESLAGSPVGTARFSCYHGVGHGVMMAEAYDLEGSLTTCDSLGDHTAQEGCWQGVFMENVNGALRGEARKGVFATADPLAPCDGVDDRYRQQCFINHAGWLLHVRNYDLAAATRVCLDAPADYVSVCMESLGLMVTNPVWQATLSTGARRPFGETAWSLCTRFPETARDDCVVAGIDNLGNFDRLDVGRSRGFCEAVAPALADACYRRIGLNLGRQTQDPAVKRTRCSSLPSRYVAACLEGAGLAPPSG